ncbi:MAG: glyoxalase [Saprospiraceae bacterium]|nr:glyoxalase [Saprospiraceae bacterium]
MDRSVVIKSDRPVIKGIEISEVMSPQEKFQNEVLRPVIKVRNNLIILIFKSHLGARMIDFSKSDIPTKTLFITNVIQKDLGLRNVLLGVILGVMSEDELNTYFTHETEYRRRINQMIIHRLSDQL